MSPGGVILNQGNGYGGCIDPQPYLADTYAQDTPRDMNYVAGLLQTAWQLLRAKFPGRS